MQENRSGSDGAGSPMTIVGDSGRAYTVERTLQDKGPPFGPVSLAKHGHTECVLKEIPKHNYDIRLRIYEIIGNQNEYLRTLEDTIKERAIFVHEYFNENLLGLVQKNLSRPTIRKILEDVLCAIRDLHMRDIVHNGILHHGNPSYEEDLTSWHPDIKADNVLINTEDSDGNGMTILKTKLADLEDAAYLPSGQRISGAQLGNWMWRSPEAHAQGPMGKPSDIFSFGIVCIYAVTGKVVLYVGEDEVPEGGERMAFVMERQLSYFADPDSFDGFIRYIGEDTSWAQLFRFLRDGFSEEHPRKPFSLWNHDGVDDDFKDLIGRLTNFDPAKRFTAEQALQHRWFQGV